MCVFWLYSKVPTCLTTYFQKLLQITKHYQTYLSVFIWMENLKHQPSNRKFLSSVIRKKNIWVYRIKFLMLRHLSRRSLEIFIIHWNVNYIKLDYCNVNGSISNLFLSQYLPISKTAYFIFVFPVKNQC